MVAEGRSGRPPALGGAALRSPLRRWAARLTSREASFVEGLVFVLTLGALTFYHFGPSLLFSVDSAEYFAQANEFLRHESGAFFFGANFVSSLGNIYYPVNFAFLPEFRLAFHGGHASPTLFYMIISAGIFAANYAQARVLGFSGRIAALSGIAILILTMPYTTKWFYALLFAWADPRWLPFFYVEPAAIAVFLLIGRGRGLLGSALAVAAFVLICLWILGTLPKPSFILLGVIAFYAGAFVLCARSLREAALKLSAGVIFAATFLLGPMHFLQGFYAFTTNSAVVPGVSIQSLADLGAALKALLYDPRQGIALAVYILGWPLLVGGTLGAALMISVWPRDRAVATFGAATLLLTAASTCFVYGVTVLGIIYPGVVLASIFLIAKTVEPLRHRLPRLVFPIGARLALVAGAAAIVVQCYEIPKYQGIAYPPGAPPVITYLRDHLAFGTGDAFRGRFLNVAGRVPDPTINLLASRVLNAEQAFERTLGNDLTFPGLAYFEIPTPQESDRFGTPRNLAFFGRFLTKPGEHQSLDYRLISRLDAKFLGLIGVRYVLADKPVGDSSFAPVAFPFPDKKLQLYALDPVNVGQYSPTHVLHAEDFAGSLEQMAAEDFDPRHDLVVDDLDPAELGMLTPAKHVEILRSKNGLRVRAESDGRSVLVLPFEYSRCLTVIDGAATPRKLFRGDFFLASVLFDRRLDADLAFRFGPFTDPRCREADALDARREGLNYDRFEAYRRQHPQLFIFLGFP